MIRSPWADDDYTREQDDSPATGAPAAEQGQGGTSTHPDETKPHSTPRREAT